jgi:protein archease
MGINAYGTDVKEVFANAALGLFSLITDPESVGEKLHLDITACGHDRDSLLVEWLNELIYCFDVRHVLFKRFEINSLTDNELEATCHGEDFDPTRHKIRIGVKAATYHMLRLDKDNNGYKAQIIIDV